VRGNAEAHEFIRAADLLDALRRLKDAPGEWTPIAGGTELMVAHAAGRLNSPRLISLWGLPELQFIEITDDSLSVGAGVTFGDIRRHALLHAEFPLLTRAASWIGAIANQNRATIAGNIVNGSPAADAPPALLAYDAEIELVSLHGKRRIPYADFHLGYKRNVLELDELVFALHLPRRFQHHVQYLRKVGARKAMAITKVALAATARLVDGSISEVRLAAASVADRPIRLLATEAVLLGGTLSNDLRKLAHECLLHEVKPIDDIRSSADYRRHVAANLLDEILSQLQPGAPLEETA
jgi:CO/xanthine dehydrogenase FAD-binding subunit